MRERQFEIFENREDAVRTKIQNFFQCIIITAICFSTLQCNDAPDGFNARSGSTISLSEDTSIETTTDGLLLMTVSVSQTIGTTQTSTTGPANGVFVIATCTKCSIFDKADGESITLPVASRLQAVSNPYTFKTDDRGTYSLVLGISAPANLGETSYQAKLTADIGVAASTMTISVSE